MSVASFLTGSIEPNFYWSFVGIEIDIGDDNIFCSVPIEIAQRDLDSVQVAQSLVAVTKITFPIVQPDCVSAVHYRVVCHWQ